jgi:CRP/FNR family transcriptional regulator
VALLEPIRGCGHCGRFPASCWSVLGPAELRLLNEYRVDLRLAPGQVLFHEHAPCHGLHCVESGLLALRKADEQGNSVILRLSHPGETLGFPAFFGRMDYIASAEALRESRLCFFPARAVQDVMQRNHGLRDEFLRLLAQELRHYGDARLKVATRPLESRLLDLLLQLLPGCGRLDEVANQAWLDLPLSRRDLAAMLGVRPETIARAVRQVGELDLARVRGREVHIPDLRRLRRDAR